jgi:DNA polymerase-3 subunit delta'
MVLGPGDMLCKPRAGEASHPQHPDSRDIRICQVRGLIDLVARYPFEARHRLIIIDPADRIGREASHTILKTLEEPPGHTVFALITSAPEAVLETIRSRCRRIDVRPVPRDQVERGLRELEYSADVAARAAAEARGRPGRALDYAEKPDLMEDGERRLERFARIAAARLPERFKYAEELAERFRRDKSAAWPDLDTWETFWERRLHDLAVNPETPDDARDAVRALQAIARAREDLLANVIARAALELMLLSFPRVELADGVETEGAA